MIVSLENLEIVLVALLALAYAGIEKLLELAPVGVLLNSLHVGPNRSGSQQHQRLFDLNEVSFRDVPDRDV